MKSVNDLVKIESNAVSMCPKNSEEICSKFAKSSQEAIDELKSYEKSATPKVQK